MYQRFKRFVKIEIPHIAESLSEEAGIEQMHTSMFCTADIFIHWQQLVDNFRIPGHLCIFIIRISEIVPGGADKRIHRIRIAFCIGTADGALAIHKALMLSQRRSAIRREVHIIGEFHRQIFFRHRYITTMRAVNDRNGSTPVSLAGNQPVAQTVSRLEIPFADGL